MTAITPAKTKQQLKDVFGGVGTLIYDKADLKIAKGGTSASAKEITLPTTGIELPVAVDSFTLTQAAPTINHYKVLGMDGDWFATSESGDIEMSLDVPTKHSDILKVLYGDDAVSDLKVSTTWEGAGLILNKKAITGTFFLINEEEDQIMILNNIKLWASPSYENGSTEPFKFTLTGTMTVADQAGDECNFAWLKKKSA
jgi:hypothetical protein